MNVTDIAQLLAAFNQTGGIPIKMIAISETAPYQFWLSIAIMMVGSIMTLFLLWTFIEPTISRAVLFTKLFRKVKRHTMIIKHTRSGFFSQNMINQDTVQKVVEGMQEFNGEPFDLILYTPGGDVFSATYLARLFKEYPGEIRAVIPIYAMSGGTMLTLACDKVYMAQTACLGPVDVQIGNLFRYGSAKAWDKIVKFKGKKAEDQSISFAMVGQQYTKSTQALIRDIASDKVAPNKMTAFVNFLTSGDVEHAYMLTPTKLKELGMNVDVMEPKVASELMKMLSSKMFEGVYAFKWKGKKPTL